MGLFDSIAGQVAGQVLGSLSGGAGNGQPAGLLEAVTGLVNDPRTGGLSGLIAAFQRGGLGELVASWVGTGQNLPISAEQLQSILGNEQVQAFAQKLGFTPQEALEQLAQFLPQVVDLLTPGGAAPEGGAVPEGGALGGLLGMLKGSAA